MSSNSCFGCIRADKFGICQAFDKQWDIYCSVCFRLTDNDEDPDNFNISYEGS